MRCGERMCIEMLSRCAYAGTLPFSIHEISDRPLRSLCLRGGFPSGLLSHDNRSSFRWRQNFVRTFPERDISQLGIRISAASIERLWRLCAHYHSQLLLTKVGPGLVQNDCVSGNGISGNCMERLKPKCPRQESSPTKNPASGW